MGDTATGTSLGSRACLDSTARAETNVVVPRRPIKAIKERLREPMAVIKRETGRGGEELRDVDVASLYMIPSVDLMSFSCRVGCLSS